MVRMGRRALRRVLGTLKTGEGQGSTQVPPAAMGKNLTFSALETRSQDIACWWWGVWFFSD